jgi:hypothetical protein
MSSFRQARPRLYGLLLALCFIPGILVVASISWLKTQPDELVFLLSGVAATVTVLASLWLTVVHDRQMGEWERSNSRFSSFWGDAVGTALVALLLAVPAARDAIVATVANFAGVPDPNFKLVMLAFVGGYMAVIIARVICMAVVSIGWTYWVSREPS